MQTCDNTSHLSSPCNTKSYPVVQLTCLHHNTQWSRNNPDQPGCTCYYKAHEGFARLCRSLSRLTLEAGKLEHIRENHPQRRTTSKKSARFHCPTSGLLLYQDKVGARSRLIRPSEAAVCRRSGPRLPVSPCGNTGV